jgi:hypothetical protein
MWRWMLSVGSVTVLAGFLAWLTSPSESSAVAEAPAPLRAGFAEADITPSLKGKTVYLAGFGQNRQATGVHDPLKARVVVLLHEQQKLALVSLDVVGFFHPQVVQLRERLPGFQVLVSSTHNHEGPDTLGLWGPNPFLSGVDSDYLKVIENRVVAAVQQAEAAARPVTGRIGTARAPELLRDNREPYVKHDELVALQLLDAEQKTAGLIVQWNCHPETLESKNTLVSSDFVGPAVAYLQERQHCPVVYLTGTVGGLMTSLGVDLRDERGRPFEDASFAKTAEYGRRVGQLAEQALRNAQPLQLTPLQVRTREIYLPMTNRLYQLGRQLGVLKREAYLWTGDPRHAEPAPAEEYRKPLCLRTEVGWLRLGDLEAAAFPGEVYPELVLDQVQDPADPGADFPKAPREPGIYRQLNGKYHLMIGLANDEIGYIIPKRQWDEKAPFCYGRQKAQYGEGNSVGPDAAPLLCEAFRALATRK